MCMRYTKERINDVIKRLPVEIILYKGSLKTYLDESNVSSKHALIEDFIASECEMVKVLRSAIPTRTKASLADFLTKNGIKLGEGYFAELTVWYSKPNYFNSSYCFSLAKLKIDLDLFLDISLIRELANDGCVDKKYLEKRKVELSDKQKANLEKLRAKGVMFTKKK